MTDKPESNCNPSSGTIDRLMVEFTEKIGELKLDMETKLKQSKINVEIRITEIREENSQLKQNYRQLKGKFNEITYKNDQFEAEVKQNKKNMERKINEGIFLVRKTFQARTLVIVLIPHSRRFE